MDVTHASRLLSPLLLASWAGSLAAAQGVAPSPDPRHPTHTYLFRERVDHALDGTRILVRAELGYAPLLQGLREAGVPAAGAEEASFEGWWLVLLSDAERDAERVGRLIERMLAVDGLAYASPVFEGAVPDTWVSPTPEILLRLDAGGSAARRSELLASLPASAAQPRALGGLADAYRIVVDERDGFEVLRSANALVERGGFDFAEPNMMFTGRGGETPNDPLFSSQWALDNVGQVGGTPGIDMDGDVAFDNLGWGPPAIVVVFDTGVELTHPDLLENIGGGADFTTGPGGSPGGGPVNACDNHGTPVAGCIAAVKGNGIGVAGLAPMCSILSARCFVSKLNCSGSWTTLTTSTVDALNWAERNGAVVSNNSNIYAFAASSAITAAYAATRTNGMVHFAAAGNFNVPTLSYPASLSTVNAVSAIDSSGAKASFSSYGTGLAFSAPGVGIRTTDRTGSAGYAAVGDYVSLNGTSFASPLVAAVAALHVTFTPGFPTPSETEAVLQARSKDLGPAGYDTTFGWGVPNAAEVVAPDGYDLYGTGTAGCFGPQTHSAWPEPHVNAPIVLTCNNAPPSTPGLFLVGFTQDVPGTLFRGVLCHLAPSEVTFVARADANGDCRRTVWIPNESDLVGATVYSQFLWPWPSSTCTPSPWGSSSSNGLAITVRR